MDTVELTDGRGEGEGVGVEPGPLKFVQYSLDGGERLFGPW
jgi:hypothetical protein